MFGWKKHIPDQWAEYLEALINWQSIIDEEAIDHLPQFEIQEMLAFEPTPNEPMQEINALWCVKATGSNALVWLDQDLNPTIYHSERRTFYSFGNPVWPYKYGGIHITRQLTK